MTPVKLGDRVRFVNENLEGIVTSIKGSTAGVTIEDDFEIPVPLSQIVKISDMQAAPEEEAAKPVRKTDSAQQGIYLAFDRSGETLLELQLHNSMADELLYVLYEKAKDRTTIKSSGRLALNETKALGRYHLDQFSQWPELHFQALLLQQHAQPAPPLQRTLRFHAKEFHAAFRHAFFLNRQAYLFKLDNEPLPVEDLQKLKEKDFSAQPAEQSNWEGRPKPVVDLHIEQLTPNAASMSAPDMLALQMEAFTKSLEMAHVHKMKSIIFIHGVGNHFLKNKIRNYLRLQKQIVASYRDADMLKYGGGATEVQLN